MLTRFICTVFGWFSNGIRTGGKFKVSRFIRRPSSSALTMLFGIGLIISLTVAACTTPNSPTAANSPSPVSQENQLKVLKMAHQKGMANLEILYAQGSLEKRLQPLGITVEWTEFPSTSPLLEAMSVKSLDFGGGGGTGSVFAQSSDKPFVRVARERSASLTGQAVLVLDQSPIQTLADLKGKKVAFAKGASSHYIIVQALKKANLKLSDIEPVFLSPADALPAFERGDIDAWVIWDPYTAQTQKSLKTRVVADLNDIFGDRATFESPAFYYATPELVSQHPDVLNVILEEVNNAGAWAKDNVGDAAQLLAKVYGLDLAIMKTVQERAGDRRIVPVDDEVLTALQQMADTFTQLKVIPKQINVKDPSYTWVSSKQWS
ncbi:aliphatic sulfonate ABC transporter substrate-binding protein [Phormidium tenue FACHB-886]|nr:aliphatic sulfonate ABC transporter substrate-binding protein [Phormidium tenue FACHB-886]